MCKKMIFITSVKQGYDKASWIEYRKDFIVPMLIPFSSLNNRLYKKYVQSYFVIGFQLTNQRL